MHDVYSSCIGASFVIVCNVYDIHTCHIVIMFVPHNCANCVCRNERASCFLAPRIMFVLVFWVRVLHHTCPRMHIRTRVCVTKTKLHAHGHARRHMCCSSVAGLQASVDIRPRPPINAGASQPNPKPHTGPHGLRPGAGPGLMARSCI